MTTWTRLAACAVAALAVGSATVPAFAQGAGPGEEGFTANCSACHQVTGKGIPGAFPALAGDPFVKGDPAPVMATVLNGRGGMPAFKADLDDAKIAAILSYVRGAWGNGAAPVTAAQVAAVRAQGPAAEQRGQMAH